MEVFSNENGRLDKILSKILNISRNQISNLIKNKNVKVNTNTILKPSFEIFIGDKIEFYLQDSKKDFKYCVAEYENSNIKVIYEDEHILIINKPPNLTVHPAPSVKEPTLVDWLITNNYLLSNINGDLRAGIVHRLDKGTSGILLVAKTNIAHVHIAKQLENKSMGRIYLALIDMPLKEDIIIDKPLKRDEKNRIKISVNKDGKCAKSAFCNIYNNANINLIAAKLYTGRTHQIRAHLASINRHILGDNLYGFKGDKDKINRVMLHAYVLYFIHPITNELMLFSAPLHDDFKNILYKDLGDIDEKIVPEYIKNVFSDVN